MNTTTEQRAKETQCLRAKRGGKECKVLCEGCFQMFAASPDAGDWKSVEDGLENMTEEKLISVFKAVSLIDLSDCSFEYGVDAENKHWCNAFENGRVVDGIVFDGNLFHMMNNNATFSPLNPMYSAYKALTLPSPPKNDNQIK